MGNRDVRRDDRETQTEKKLAGARAGIETMTELSFDRKVNRNLTLITRSVTDNYDKLRPYGVMSDNFSKKRND